MAPAAGASPGGLEGELAGPDPPGSGDAGVQETPEVASLVVLANLLLFANFGTIKYLLYCGSRRNRLAGTEPIPMRFRNTGWGTLRRPFALVSIENVVIVTESCEMTVCTMQPVHVSRRVAFG